MEYFLAITDEQREELLRLGVNKFENSSSIIIGGVLKSGIVVREEYADWTLYALGQKRASEVTIFRGFNEIIYEPGTPFPLPEVYAVNWPVDHNLTRRDCFVHSARRILLPLVKKPILIFQYCDVANAPAFEKEPFHIHVWSSVTGYHNAGNPGRPDLIFGIPVSSRWNWFAPANQGKVIYSGNTSVAEIIGNNLFIFLPLHDAGFSQASEVFEKILEKVAIWLSLDDSGRKAQEAEFRRQQFLRAALKSMTSERDAAQAEKTLSESRIKQFGEQAVSDLQAYRDARRRLVVLSDARSVTEKLGGEFDSLLRNDRIKKIVIQGQDVTVYTHCLFCRDPRTGKTHELGKFKILFSQREGISFFNLTRRVCGMESGMNAPHVFPQGNPCWGSAEEVVMSLRKNGEFGALIPYCIQYLESVNVEDTAGRYVNNWPEVVQKPSVDTAPVSAA